MIAGVAMRTVLAVMLGVTWGCFDQVVLIHFENRTDRVIDVILVNPDTGNEYDLQPDIQPGTTTSTRSDVYPGSPCTDRGTLIARDNNGIEVGRRTDRFCKGDTWVIEVGGPNASASPT